MGTDTLREGRNQAHKRNSRPPSTAPPGLAVLDKAPAPYRVHILKRLAREIPELKFHSLFNKTFLEGHKWDMTLPDEINAQHFVYGNERAEEKWWRHPIRDFKKAIQMQRYLVEHNVRAVIIFGYTTYSHRSTYRFCFRRGIPIFFIADSNIRNPPPRTIVHKVVKNLILPPILKRCTGVLSMGELGDAYFEKYGADPETFFRVPYEPDYDSIVNIPQSDVDDFRCRYGLSADRKYMVYSGRLMRRKRVDLLIEAFVRCADERPEWDVLILGDGEELESLQALVPDRLKSRVKWPGYLQMDDVERAYHASDLLVIPSDFEPWALVVNEAMTAGLPVIASDVVGASWEMVRDQGCGEIFPKGDLDALTRVICQVTDPDRYPQYQSAVAPALKRWRTIADPVKGVRSALEYAGVLPRK